MSEGLNKVFLQGNLTADPELRQTQGGTSVLKIRMATNGRYKSGDEWKDKVEYHNVDVWGARAEGLGRILEKGSGVLIEGSLATDSWDKDGVKQYKTYVRAHNVILTDGGRGRDDRDDDRGGRDRDDRSRSRDDDRNRDRGRGRDDRDRDEPRRDRREGRDDDGRDRGRDDSRGGFE